MFLLFRQNFSRHRSKKKKKKKDKLLVQCQKTDARYRGRIGACLVIKRKSQQKEKKNCCPFFFHTHANKYTDDREVEYKGGT